MLPFQVKTIGGMFRDIATSELQQKKFKLNLMTKLKKMIK